MKNQLMNLYLQNIMNQRQATIVMKIILVIVIIQIIICKRMFETMVAYSQISNGDAYYNNLWRDKNTTIYDD